MIVLHIIIGLNTGGAEKFLSRLILANKSNPKFQSLIISLMPIGKIGEQLQSEGVYVETLNLKSVLGLPIVFFKLFRRIKNIKPDIVHTWMYHSDLVGGLAAFLAGFKNIIWSIRCSDISKEVSYTNKMLIKINSYLSKYLPKKIIVNSVSGLKDHLKLGYYSSKLIHIPNGFDVISYLPCNKEIKIKYNINNNDFVIGVIGRFHSMKDHHTFIKAIEIVFNRHSNIKILMIGKNLDWQNNILASWLNECMSKSCFILLGECNNVFEYISIMDILCSSSISEGFPNVVAESMMMRVPCVVTDVGDSAIIVNNCGVVVPPNNPQKLALGILDLLELTNEQRKQLGERAYRQVKENYSIALIQKKYLEIYNSLINEK